MSSGYCYRRLFKFKRHCILLFDAIISNYICVWFSLSLVYEFISVCFDECCHSVKFELDMHDNQDIYDSFALTNDTACYYQNDEKH